MLFSDAMAVSLMPESFAFYPQNDKIDVGSPGGEHINRFGNVNSTVIGSCGNPKGRLLGSGGSAESAMRVDGICLITPHQARHFWVKYDFATGAGFLSGRAERRACAAGCML